MTDNEKYVKRDQALIIGDDPQRLDGVMSANRNKAGAPFQYAESPFATLAVVKSMTGLPCRHLYGSEAASIHEDSISSHTASRITPITLKVFAIMFRQRQSSTSGRQGANVVILVSTMQHIFNS